MKNRIGADNVNAGDLLELMHRLSDGNMKAFMAGLEAGFNATKNCLKDGGSIEEAEELLDATKFLYEEFRK